MKVKYLTISAVVVSCLGFSSLYAVTQEYNNTYDSNSKRVVLDENYLKNKGKASSINNVDNSAAPPHM